MIGKHLAVERTRVRQGVETFLISKGFNKDTLSILSYDNLMKLAEDYRFLKRK
ncbi:hypothetical protein HRF87_10220 [Bacillus sp. CRN 9]|nr:hypothetical protein [Bacillus sp. CRN 9]